MTEFVPQSSHAAHRVPLFILLAGIETKVSKDVIDAGA